MAISKSSIRIQFTLNKEKEKEKLISKFLDGFVNPNNTIKEIIYNHIVSNGDGKLLQASNLIMNNSDTKSLKVTQSDSLCQNKESNYEEKLHKLSEIELNEMNELSKFL